MTKLSRAIEYTTERFDGVLRKAENSYAVFHSLEAAAIAQAVCDDEDVICAAVLHDTVEDTGASIDEIKELFGDRVAFLVASETEEKFRSIDPSATWLKRKLQSLNELRESTDNGVRAIWMGDKLSNMRSLARLKLAEGDGMWEHFNEKDPKEHEKYYKAIAKELEVFSDTLAYAEYIKLLTKVFEE